MTKRDWGMLDVETSLLGFGCMRFPIKENGKIDIEKVDKMVEYAMEHQVNYYDTAYPYHNGESELVMGKLLKKYPRESFYLATKLPCWSVHNKEDAIRIFNEQLTKLQTDYIDFYLLHALNGSRYEEMTEVGAVDQCIQWKQEGKIKNLGFSFHGSYDEFEQILLSRKWDFCQIQLNYMDLEEQAGLRGYELAKEHGVPVIIMEPIKGGSLAKLPDDILEYIEDGKGRHPVELALRFVADFTQVKVILSGMNSLEQVKDNVATFEPFEPLSESEQKMIERIRKALLSRIQNGCTHCGYCMPCPAGVNIPKNFDAWNQYHIYQNKWQLQWSFKANMPENQKAKNCIECGICEGLCPQNISIREDLKKVQKDLDSAMKEA